MSYARQLLDTYPRDFDIDVGMLAATIDALNDCAQACTADTDADLGQVVPHRACRRHDFEIVTKLSKIRRHDVCTHTHVDQPIEHGIS